MDVFQHILERKLSAKFLKAYSSGKIKDEKEPPFYETDYSEGGKVVQKSLRTSDEEWGDLKLINPGQPFRSDMIRKFGLIIGDPDFDLPNLLKDGVEMGDGEKIMVLAFGRIR